MAAHPDDAAKVRAANRSYVFFGITGLTNKGEPPIIGTAGGLHQPAAAITKAVARLCVAELPRLARIAETINALRDRFRPARERLRLAGRDARGVAASAEHLQETRSVIAHVLPFDLETAGFVQALCLLKGFFPTRRGRTAF
jgi:hypothetical protein